MDYPREREGFIGSVPVALLATVTSVTLSATLATGTAFALEGQQDTSSQVNVQKVEEGGDFEESPSDLIGSAPVAEKTDEAESSEPEGEAVPSEAAVEKDASKTEASKTAASQKSAKVKYTVLHFKVEADGSVVAAGTEELEGAEGSEVTVTPKTFKNYTYDAAFNDGGENASVESGKLVSGKDLVLKAYYKADDQQAAKNGSTLVKSADAASLKTQSQSSGGSDSELVAMDSNEASGEWGGCTWTLDADGVLTVSAGTLGDNAGQLSEALGDSAENVKKIVFAGTVVAPEDCTSLFGGFENVGEIDLSGFDTSGTKVMSALFRGCESLETVNMDSLDFSNVTETRALFYGCSSLKSLSMANVVMPLAEDLRAFFYGCDALETVDLSGLVASAAKNMGSMFYGCSSLKTVNMSGLKATAAEDMSGMFFGCSKLESVDMSSLSAPVLEDMRAFFYNCTSLVTATLTGLDVPSVKDMSAMFSGCSSLKTVDMSDVNAPAVEDLGALFMDCSSLTSVNLTGFNTSSVTTTGAMFSGCKSLPSVDVSSLDTSNVTKMLAMFNGCSSLKELDLSAFNTSKVDDMGGMFFGCTSLTRLDLTSFDTSNVWNMIAMFAGCTSLMSVDVSSFDTSSVPELGAAADDAANMLSVDPAQLRLKVESVINLEDLGLENLPIELPELEASSIWQIGGNLLMFTGDGALQHVVVGEKGNHIGMLPSYPVYGHTDWYSANEKRWFTSQEIYDSRRGIADTYTKYGPINRPTFSITRSYGSSSLARTGDTSGAAALLALLASAISALVALVARPLRRR